MTSDAEQMRAALRALVKMTEQWCHVELDSAGEHCLDSASYSSNAAAMRTLADHGLLSINSQFGNRVIAKWTEAAREFGVDPDFSQLGKPRSSTRRTPSSGGL